MPRHSTSWWAIILAAGIFPATSRAGPYPDGGRGIVTQPLIETLAPSSLEIAVWARAHLDEEGTGFVASPVTASVGLTKRVDFSLSARTISTADPERRRSGIDPRSVGAKYRILDERGWRPGTALRLTIVQVVGAVDLHPQLVLQKTYSPFKLVFGVGYYGAFVADAATRRAVVPAVGAQAMFVDWNVAVEVSGRLQETQRYLGGSLAVGSLVAHQVAPEIQLVFGLRGAFGIDATDLTFTVGFVYSATSERDSDADGDGIADFRDRCPNEPEDFNEYQDDDGCIDGGPPELVPAEVEREAPRFTTPVPRFRMRIPERRLKETRVEVPDDGETRQ